MPCCEALAELISELRLDLATALPTVVDPIPRFELEFAQPNAGIAAVRQRADAR